MNKISELRSKLKPIGGSIPENNDTKQKSNDNSKQISQNNKNIGDKSILSKNSIQQKEMNTTNKVNTVNKVNENIKIDSQFKNKTENCENETKSNLNANDSNKQNSQDSNKQNSQVSDTLFNKIIENTINANSSLQNNPILSKANELKNKVFSETNRTNKDSINTNNSSKESNETKKNFNEILKKESIPNDIKIENKVEVTKKFTNTFKKESIPNGNKDDVSKRLNFTYNKDIIANEPKIDKKEEVDNKKKTMTFKKEQVSNEKKTENTDEINKKPIDHSKSIINKSQNNKLQNSENANRIQGASTINKSPILKKDTIKNTIPFKEELSVNNTSNNTKASYNIYSTKSSSREENTTTPRQENITKLTPRQENLASNTPQLLEKTRNNTVNSTQKVFGNNALFQNRFGNNSVKTENKNSIEAYSQPPVKKEEPKGDFKAKMEGISKGMTNKNIFPGGFRMMMPAGSNPEKSNNPTKEYNSKLVSVDEKVESDYIDEIIMKKQTRSVNVHKKTIAKF